MKALATAILVIAVWASLSVRMTAENAPVSLYSSKAFRLTLREDKNSNLPFSPGCSNEARLTLACRAFVLELENLSKHTVQLINPSCNEPSVTMEERRVAQTSTEDWVEITATNQNVCNPPVWNRIRVRPGKTIRYRTRIISANRSFAFGGWFPFVHTPGTHTIRARWQVQGCVLHPQQAGDCPADSARVTVTSNNITVDSPPIGELGTPNLSFEVAASEKPLTPSQQERCTQSGASIDCTLFHYHVRNAGRRALILLSTSCGDGSGIGLEYRGIDGNWRTYPRDLWTCSRNVPVVKSVLPGAGYEGEFTLPTLDGGYDTKALPTTGTYQLRFSFSRRMCVASPDGRLCLTTPEYQTVTSNELTVAPGKRDL